MISRWASINLLPGSCDSCFTNTSNYHLYDTRRLGPEHDFMRSLLPAGNSPTRGLLSDFRQNELRLGEEKIESIVVRMPRTSAALGPARQDPVVGSRFVRGLQWRNAGRRPDPVVSEVSSAPWVDSLAPSGWDVTGEGTSYTFPRDVDDEIIYGMVEGALWIARDQIVVVSDRAKPEQDRTCPAKDQSIRIFRIPAS